MIRVFLCRKKVFWLSIILQASIEDWTMTPWKEINVELMDMELRRFSKVQQPIFKQTSPLPQSVCPS